MLAAGSTSSPRHRICPSRTSSPTGRTAARARSLSGRGIDVPLGGDFRSGLRNDLGCHHLSICVGIVGGRHVLTGDQSVDVERCRQQVGAAVFQRHRVGMLIDVLHDPRGLGRENSKRRSPGTTRRRSPPSFCACLFLRILPRQALLVAYRAQPPRAPTDNSGKRKRFKRAMEAS